MTGAREPPAARQAALQPVDAGAIVCLVTARTTGETDPLERVAYFRQPALWAGLPVTLPMPSRGPR